MNGPPLVNVLPGLDLAYWVIIGLTAVGSVVMFGYAIWFGLFVAAQRHRRRR